MYNNLEKTYNRPKELFVKTCPTEKALYWQCMEPDFTKFVCAITFRNFMFVIAAGIHSGEILYKKEKINVRTKIRINEAVVPQGKNCDRTTICLKKKRVWSRYGRKYFEKQWFGEKANLVVGPKRRSITSNAMQKIASLGEKLYHEYPAGFKPWNIIKKRIIHLY